MNTKRVDIYAIDPQTGKTWRYADVTEDRIKMVEGQEYIQGDGFRLWEVVKVVDVSKQFKEAVGYFKHFGTSCE